MRVRTLVFVVIGLAQVAAFVVFLNTGVAELVQVAESLPYVTGTWVSTPLERIKSAAYLAIVPIFLIDIILYAIYSGHQQEKQQERLYRGGY
ncbi:hypothetical protein C5B91_20140 [Haloferax sp. Atlit-10N]|uniref:hypothetical protein n=1 Tax=unclassified Haloferax TaxID=2625095 RepID=UPI000E2893F3|nr:MULTISPECIES: hypothetical protein [unclassified Haloferax]RDZ39405.1 hypothetical protein C5B87_19400 [Haloferax sp. Atlit-16N]RDZ53920.1 hypothetical protein C5B91_20140 [Haloferax sp. Atlit-10N]